VLAIVDINFPLLVAVSHPVLPAYLRCPEAFGPIKVIQIHSSYQESVWFGLDLHGGFRESDVIST